MSSTNFVIVTFDAENDAPGIVALNWIIDSRTCYYPNVRTEAMKNKLLKRMADPEVTWSHNKIRILKRYETYGEARLHLKKAEDTSNLDSDEEVTKRKRKIKNVYSPDDSNSSDEYYLLLKKIWKKNDEQLTYPTPPKPKSVLQNIFTEEIHVSSGGIQSNNVTVTTNSAEDNITVPQTESSPRTVEQYTYEEIIEDPMEIIPNENFRSKEAVNNCPPVKEEFIVSNEMTVDVNTAVDSPITILPSSNQETIIQLELETCKEAEKAENGQLGCNTCKQFSIQQSHLIQVVTDLSNQMTELNRKVNLLLGRSGDIVHTNLDDNESIAEICASLPVKDDPSFEHLNEQLKNSQNKQAIMEFLTGIGGKNVRSLTTNILRRLLMDEVAEFYSLTGKKMKNSNKKSFMTTETFKLILQICKKIFEDVTEKHIKEIISDWLNQAKFRITRRAERQEKEREDQ